MRVSPRDRVPCATRRFHGVVDGRAPFNLLTVDIFVEQLLKQIVRERGIDA
jgi:hypothetical protein